MPSPRKNLTKRLESQKDIGSNPHKGMFRNYLSATFASLQYQNFLYLWLGQVTHAGGLWLEMVALPLLVLDLTGGSAVHLGLIMATRTAPAVVFGLVAGIFADNFDRRLVMLVTKIVVLILSALFVSLLITDLLVLWQLYVFTFLRGASMAFDQPARRAIIPSIVPNNLVTNAVALTMGSVQIMRIAGAAGAGLIIGFGSLSAAFGTVVFLYAGAVIFTWFLNVPDHERQSYRGIRYIVTDFNESIRFAWGNATIRGVIIIGIGYAIFGMAFMQVFAPLFAKQVLGIGDVGFGYMMSITGLGGLIGALVLAFLNPNRHRGLLMLGMMAVSGILFIGLAGVTYLGSLTLVFVMAILMGTTQSGLFPLTNAVLIEVSPDQIRGRVIGLLSMDRAMTALGGALAGFLAAAIGSQLAQMIFGAGCVVVALVMFVAYPRLRQIQ